METGDEFDNGATGPVPPHERAWRHPTEMHPQDRERIPAVATPPPVSRRTRGILTSVGVCATAVLVALAVPNGVPGDGDQSPAAVTPVTTPSNVVPVVKGSTRPLAVEFTDGWFAVHSVGLGAKAGRPGSGVEVITVDGSTREVRHAADLEELSVVVYVGAGDDDRCDFQSGYDDAEFRYLLEAGSLSVIDRSSVRHSVRNSLELEPADGAAVPLHVDSGIDGVGVLVAFDDRPVGLVSVVDHRTVAVLLPGLGRLICGA